MMSRDFQTAADHLLRTLAAVPVESRLLHVGCGSGSLTRQLARLGFDIFACDVDAESVIRARERLEGLDRPWGDAEPGERVRSATATSLPFPDDTFDWVVAHDVYNRAAAAENVVEMVQETCRVLKPGGWVHCTVEAHSDEQNEWDQLDSIVYQNGSRIGAFFSRGDLADLMSELDLAEAEEPFSITASDTTYLCGIYRKVDAAP